MLYRFLIRRAVCYKPCEAHERAARLTSTAGGGHETSAVRELDTTTLLCVGGGWRVDIVDVLRRGWRGTAEHVLPYRATTGTSGTTPRTHPTRNNDMIFALDNIKEK